MITTQNKVTEEHSKSKVINIFRTKDDTMRKRNVQEALANIICRSESNDVIRYIRVK